MSTPYRPVAEADGTDSRLRRLHELAPDDPDRAVLRADIIEAHLPLARRLALRFHDTDEALDDLIQAARLALVKAVDGFDPDRGVPFEGHAVLGITGSLAHDFRAMSVPHAGREPGLELSTGVTPAGRHLERTPTIAQLAAHLHVDRGTLLDTLGADSTHQPVAPDASPAAEISALDDHHWIRSVIAGMPERERRVLTLRYFHQMTHSQIGNAVGLSQMHVSRILKRGLARLQYHLAAAEESGHISPPPWPG